jgi:AP-2 complex subunit sigma-1
MVLSFILVQNRQGKTRLAKWYAPYTDEEKVKLKGEVSLLSHPKETTLPVSPWTVYL